MQKLSSRGKRDLAAVSFLTLLCGLLFIDVLAGQRDFFIRDLARYYHPTKAIIREIVMSGEFPWWNPYYSAGQPMAANPEYEVFYPFQWFILLPGFEVGFRLHILFHVWLTAVGMYAFLRSLRIGAWPSLFGAIAWGYGGLTLSLINLLPILFAAAWLPLVLLFVRRALRRFTLRDAALASIAGGMQVLVGEPTTLVQTWLIIGMYSLWRMWRLRSRGWRAIVDPMMIVALVLTWSVSIGSVQLIPAIDHAGDTVRSRGFDHELVTAWSFPPQRMLELVYPHLFGRMDVDGRTLYWAGGGIYGRPASPFFFSIHFGALAFALLIAGLVTRRSGRGRLVAFVTPFLLIALGRFNPVYEWAIEAGLRVPFRYPEKFVLSAMFGIVVFSTMMFARITRGDRVLLRRTLWVMAGVMVVASGIVVLSHTPAYEQAFTRLWGVETSHFRDQMLRASRSDWYFAAAVSMVLTALLGVGKNVAGSRWWAPVAVLVLMIELVPVGLDASPRIRSSFYDIPGLATELPDERDRYRIFHEVDWYGRSDTARRWFSTGRGVYWIVRNGLYPMTPGNYGFRTVLERDYDRTALLPTVDLVRSMWEVRDRGQKRWASIFMEMSNVRFRSRYRDRDQAIEEARRDFRFARPVEMLEVGTSPRYYFAEGLVQVRDRQHFVDLLVEKAPELRTAFVFFEPFEPAGGEVSAIAESSSGIRLRVRSAGRSFLVLSVTPHRYWRAEVDGEQRALQVANIGYQGLVIEQGESEIVLRYRNPVVVATAPVSGSALLVALVFACSGRRHHRGPLGPRAPQPSTDAQRVEEHARGIPSDRDA